MKAMMSEKLRNILNDPVLCRELQKQLSQSSDDKKSYNEKTTHKEKDSIAPGK